MKKRTKISFIFGTRPEAIKLAPLINYLKLYANIFDVNICLTGQHKEMVRNILPIFNINANFNLALMQKNQTLAGFFSKAIKEVDSYLKKVKPDIIIIQGDTSSVTAAAISGYYNKIPIVHVEAGLRTHNKYSPFPEEINRQIVSRIADLHCAPTKYSKNNLLNEGVEEKNICVTGNTVIDSILFISKHLEKYPINNAIINKLNKYQSFKECKVILITGHRRENFGKGFEEICDAINIIGKNFKDYLLIYPVHLNPNVKNVVYNRINKADNILLTSPLDYLTFVTILKKSYLVLTDSGGIQEEAPTFKKPVLIMRDTTERPEGIDAGCSKLVGISKKKIVDEVTVLIKDKKSYNKMICKSNPFGKGKASKLITNELIKRYTK